MVLKIHLVIVVAGLSLWFSRMAWAGEATISGPTDPETVSAYNEGVTLINQGKSEAAAEKFKQAIKKSPSFAEAHGNLGAALVKLGKYDEALPELKKATELKPDSAPIWGTLGTCYQTLGHSPEAVQSFKMYLKCAPSAPDAQRVRSMVALLENEIKRTAGQPPEDPNAPDYLADSTQNGMSRWPKSRMPITVYIDENPTVPGFDSQTPAILRAAFTDWQDALKGLVEFKFVTEPGGAEIKCKWTHDASQMISSAEGGHALVIPDKEGIVKTDITLLTTPPQGSTKITANYARRIYLHEIGHALGVLGHSKNPKDVMFSSIPPADVPIELTERDKNTLIALYSASGAEVSSHPIDVSKMMLSGDPNSAVNKVVKLNAEGAEAMQKGNLVLSIEKFEEARKLDPSSELVAHNLGAAYQNAGMLASMARNWVLAEEMFKKAIPLVERQSDKQGLGQLLQAYSFVLKVEKKTAEAAKIEARLQSLSGH